MNIPIIVGSLAVSGQYTNQSATHAVPGTVGKEHGMLTKELILESDHRRNECTFEVHAVLVKCNMSATSSIKCRPAVQRGLKTANGRFEGSGVKGGRYDIAVVSHEQARRTWESELG